VPVSRIILKLAKFGTKIGMLRLSAVCRCSKWPLNSVHRERLLRVRMSATIAVGLHS
jgi:hypothetical protein